MKKEFLVATVVVGVGVFALSAKSDGPATTQVDQGAQTAQAARAKALEDGAGKLIFLADQSDVQLRNGIAAAEQAIEVVEENLANAATTAYKRRDPYQNGQGNVRIAVNMEQGALESTGRPLDVGISGDGMFRVKVLDTIGDGFAYTRFGNLFINANGELVVGLGDGYRFNPPITLPRGVTEDQIQISEEGEIDYVPPGSTRKSLIGQLQLTNFANPGALKPIGGPLYQETDQSGPPISGVAGQNGTGKTLSNFLEKSNVDMRKEKQRIRKLKEWREAMLDVMEGRVGKVMR